MPTALILPILLRVLATAIFALAAIYAGVANRSFLIVPCLAAAAAAAQYVTGLIAPSPIQGLKFAFDPEARPPNPLSKAGRGFAMGVVLYGLLFSLAAMIAALFQETEFERALTGDDGLLVAVAAGFATVFSSLSARTGTSQIAGMMGNMQEAFADMQAQQATADMAAGDDEFIVEGEIIEPDEKTP